MSGLHHLKTIIIQSRGRGDANIEIKATESWYNKPGIFQSISLRRSIKENLRLLRTCFLPMLIFCTLDSEWFQSFRKLTQDPTTS